MTTNKERPLTSFNDPMQSQLRLGSICLPKIFKVTGRSELQRKPKFKIRQEGNIQGDLPLPDNWLPKFTEFMRATGQPNVESSSAAHSQDESPSLDDQRTYVIHDQWEKAEPIYKKRPDLKTIPLSSDGGTALHLAVKFNRTSFFKGLMDVMTPEDLEVRNEDENTAFFMCASSGNVEFAQSMLRKNPGLAMIKGVHKYGYENEYSISLFPIHVAASAGHRQMLQLLCPATVLDDLDFILIKRLFFTTLLNNIFDVAYAMLEQCPTLAASRYESYDLFGLHRRWDKLRELDRLTPLHVLAQKPQEELYDGPGSCGWGHLLMTRLWTAAKFMEPSEMLDFIRNPSHILFDAVNSGNIKILDLVFQSDPELLMHERWGENLFQIAVSRRQENVLIYLIEKRVLADHLMLAIDDSGNNILHFAGKLHRHETLGSLPPLIQMQRELLWFKKMENRVPSALITMRNYEAETPKDVFNREHADLLVQAGVAAKDTANCGMLAATIITTIVFAASLTVPGHDVSPKADSSILQKEGWYIIFILSNSIALFSSSSSTIFFLSVLTSSWKEDAFISSLHVRLLTLGVTTLFVSTIAMVVAFVAACFLIFNHLSTWVAYLVASLGFLTVALFVLIPYALFGDLIRSFYWSLYLLWPANYYQRLKSSITVFIRMMKSLVLKIPNKLPKMCQLAKAKKRLQEDNPV